MTRVKFWALACGLLVLGQTEIFSQKKLLSFDVQLCDRNIVAIQWTKIEKDSFDYFVEKSGDEKTWERIANINLVLSPFYDYIDLHRADGIAYYRIAETKQKELVAFSDSRRIQVSKEIQVNNPGKLYVWPTPANDIIHVRTPFARGNMDIIDVHGRFIRKITIIDSITDVPLQAFPAGMYLIHIRHGNDVLVEKFIKQQGF